MGSKKLREETKNAIGRLTPELLLPAGLFWCPSTGAATTLTATTPTTPLARPPGSGISSGATSPHHIQTDDFLRSTMKLFLLVTPPAARIQGRSKSLTHIDALDSAMLAQRGEDGDSRSEPDTTVVTAGSQDRLVVPVISTQAAGAGAAGSYTLGPAGSDPAMRRRRLSNLYKIASSEYFSVSFDCLDDPGPEEFVAASKGTNLRESLGLVCERRGVDLNSVHVYLDSSKTPLSLTTTETFWLGGKHLRIKAKDEVKSPIRSLPAKPILQQQSSRKGSGSYRSGKNSRILSGAASTEDPASAGDAVASSTPASTNHSHHGAVVNTSAASHEGSLKAKGSKTSTRWSGLFSSSYKDTKMDSLVEQLNEYSRHGIPRLPYLLSFEADEEDDTDEDGLYRLEDDWKQIVVDWGSLPERTRQQQNAIWELVQTELAYLRTLKVITDLFMACLCNLQAAQILNEIDTERLFSNIPEIYVANRQFWVENVVPMLEAARAAQAPLDPAIMREAFVKFDELFHPYTKYCLEQTHCQQYCKEKDHDNELFKAYLAWCETQRDCNRLRLMDILVKPMQRLTKYSLLLKAIHKKTDDENHKTSLIEMIQGVESFVGNVNSALRQRHEQERLREIISRIESYDAVEAKDEEIERLLKTHCDLDLTRPMPGCSEHQRRHLLTEGDLKLKDQVSSKADVHCFLFTDILLICKPVARKAERVKVIRPPFLVDRLVAIELAKDPAAVGFVYLNELGTASAAFSLHAPEVKQSKAWLDNIRKAQELYREAKAAAAAAHADTLYFVGDEDDDMDFPASALLVARSPRGSSRGSRGSSLVHSHSGSVDMNDTSGVAAAGAYARNPSVEIGDVKRASSASSEDSAGGASAVTVTGHATGTGMKISSPRPERRSMLGRPHHHSHSASPTPNTLTVQVPHIIASHQGQSLPNLLSLSVPVPVNAAAGLSSSSTSLLHTAKAPSSAMSQRGVSYPPPSPRGLTRTQPVPQSRNPPLVKTRRIVSTAGTTEASVIESLVEATNFNVEVPSGAAPTKTDHNCESNDACSETVHEADDEIADQESDDLNRQLLNAALAKRLTRNERLDNRRYHTAGAIEDIKKQDTKNSSIHKRLSWNYGHQVGSPPTGSSGTPGSSLSGSRVQLRSGMISAVNTDSMLSFSSSGVSSTGSLHLSTASEAEDTEAEVEVKPHVSSTYIGGVEATNVQVRLYQDKASANVFQLTDPPSRPLPPPPPPRCLPVPPPTVPFNNDLRIDVSEVCDGISSVQITVSSADGAKPSRADLIRMKDLILGDASMEASEV